MPKGGARPGAGRKPKPELYARPIRAAERKIADRLPLIVDRLLDLAQGVTVQETGDDGTPRVYARPPDRQAAQYLVDRIMGKPTEPVDVTSGGASLVKAYRLQDVERV